ncbi:hypothetical protein K443DRAFT_435368 [Laccaria amethystina LaAM-08-1]|uniref:Uncharacterized protein n=1 Tax=Laccaria amethystina LaAM-08-1 TaxID=1095629 RepID=A0A0C9X4C6_9AGAR|nr:hypothetical protein K443DRAFT_435368 [Laccaria amethystina LaAM-08-1]
MMVGRVQLLSPIGNLKLRMSVRAVTLIAKFKPNFKRCACAEGILLTEHITISENNVQAWCHSPSPSDFTTWNREFVL